MICPNCESDHRAGLTVCPECGAPLVETVTPLSHEAPEMVEVWRGDDPDRLPLVESLLRDEGIEFVVEGDQAFGVLPLPVTGVRVLVTAVNASAARDRLVDLQ